MAVDAGVPAGPYGLEAYIAYTGTGLGAGAEAYEGKYVWYVSSWIDPPSSDPRRDIYAVIDPASGEVYAVLHGG